MRTSRSRRITEKPRRAFLDKELLIVHAKRECMFAKMAVKYDYLQDLTDQMGNLPAMMQGFNWKRCPKCGDEL